MIGTICSVCNEKRPFNPLKKQGGYVCDNCGKSVLECCARYVTHKDFAGQRIFCTTCCAELTLSGVSPQEYNKPLPGTEATK